MELRILLADDHKVMLEGLCALIEKEKGFKVVATTADGQEAVRLTGALKPDLVIMDIGLPELNGIEATRRILEANPEVKVIALTVHADPNYVVKMIKAGAKGYILKQCAYEEISRAIRSVAAGRAYLSPDITLGLLQDLLSRGDMEGGSVYAALSSREREVLQLLAEGNSNKTISNKLNISIKTVESHRNNVMRKFGLSSLADLVRLAIREGLVTP